MGIENDRRSPIATIGQTRQGRSARPPKVEVRPLTQAEEAELPTLAGGNRASIFTVGTHDLPRRIEFWGHSQPHDEALLSLLDGVVNEGAVRQDARAILAKLALLDEIVREVRDRCLDDDALGELKAEKVGIRELRAVVRAEHQPDRVQQCGLGTVASPYQTDQSLVDHPLRGFDATKVLNPESAEHHGVTSLLDPIRP
uniref:MC27 n=1 Tax=Micrococcus sp. 28 TaxID=161213 RepID=Q8VPP6_9MICC|nr:MC27 [Micrococcus sp. 28]